MKTNSTLPFAADLPADAAPASTSLVMYEEPIKILIVDDEPKNLVVLETVLDDPSYRLVRAESAEQALLALIVDEFALLILDVRMPGMTGFELAQMIKERKKTSRIPIIFLTAYYNEDQHVLEGYGAGAVDYLHKPVNPPILRCKVAVFAELYRKSRQFQQVNGALLAEVTQRRQAEQQMRELNESLEQRVKQRTEVLREREHFLQRMTDVSPSIIVVFDLEEERCVFISRSVAFVLGYSAEEISAMGDNVVPMLMHPGDLASFNTHLERVRLLRDDETADFEHRLRDRAGDWRWFHNRDAAFARDAAGAVSQLIGTAIEITARKQAEDKLRASEDRFRAALGAVSDIIWTNNAEGKMEGDQPVWAAFTGQSQGEYQGFGWSSAVHPEDAQPTIDAWNLAVAEDRPFSFEHRVRRHDGQWRVCSVRAVPVLDAEGRTREWVGVHTDITEHNAAQQELTRHRENLERSVEERTAELAASTVALHTSERLAALGTLAAGLGHDIANLSLPIRMRLQMLEASCATDDNRKDFAAVGKSLDHLSNLSAGMRLMAMDPERGEASTPAADLEAWCAETSPVLRAGLPRHLHFECQAPRGLGVSIPRHRLAQVVFNLVQNAGEAMADQPTGTVRVTAEAASSAAGGPVVRIRVEDDGPGMSAELVARCFEPYFSTKGRAIATGMGLGMVRGIVESAGGAVSVCSAPGKGTTFTLILPAAGSMPSSGAAAAPTAAVTIQSQREASLAMMFLGQLAFKTYRHLDSTVPDVSLWVVERPDPSRVRAYLDQHPLGRMVVIEGATDSGRADAGGQEAVIGGGNSSGGDSGEQSVNNPGNDPGNDSGLSSRSQRVTMVGASPSPGDLRDAITRASHTSVVRIPVK